MKYQQNNPLKLVVLISGNGSNLQAIIDAIANGLPAKIMSVISNRADAFGLERAQQANIATHVISTKDFPDAANYDTELQKVIENYHPDLIILAGFMRILTAPLVQHFRGKILNIHPSLLPKYRGLHTHQRALEAGDAVHGVTVHFVTEELDGGPIIAQREIKIASEDTAETLKQKIHLIEHRLYPEVINWFAEGKIVWQEDGII